MTNEQALLLAIRADPDDELARLALADWLDDNGDPPRAEFVRVQCQLARGGDGPLATQKLRDREKQLLKDHSRRWLGPFADTNPPVWRFERGTAVFFLPAAELLTKETLARAAEWFPRAWVLDLRLTGSAANLPTLFEQPWLGRLSRLHVGPLPAGTYILPPRDLKALASCQGLSGLWSLRLTGLEMGGRIGQLADSPLAGSLGALALADDTLTPDDLGRLAATFPCLRRLSVSGVTFDRKKLDALTGAGWPETLTSLQLTRSLPSNVLPRLLDSPRLECLEELNLGGNDVRTEGAARIASCVHLATLRRLGLRNSHIGSPGAAALAESKVFAALELLDVWDSGAGRPGTDRLSKRFGPALWARLEEPRCWAV